MRLFVAILIDDKIRRAVARLQNRLGTRCDRVRWVHPDNIHLTVKFLGEVPDGDVMSVCELLTEAGRMATGFDMTIAGCGCFPQEGKVRTIWAGVREPPEALTQCVEAVELAMEVYGIPRERRSFSAHVTIGRLRGDRSAGRIRSTVAADEFVSKRQRVKSVALMASVLSRKGPTYSVVTRITLGGTERVESEEVRR